MSIAAKSLGVDRTTLYAWLKDPELKDAVMEGRAQRIDFAESALDKRINAGDTTAIIFFLKTQGRERGYSQDERQDNKVEVTVKYEEAPSNITDTSHGADIRQE